MPFRINGDQTSSDSAIEMSGLTHRFKKHVAIQGLNFKVPKGAICGFLGPNGAGKTTTLRILLGLLPPTSGNVQVLGLDPFHKGHELRRRIGFVPDVSHLYKWMTIKEVFTFAADVYGNWDDQACRTLTDRLNLPFSRTVCQLSRGELAKVNLIIAMAHHPELLILDEPTTGLDPLIRDEFLNTVLDFARVEGATIFFSSHILSDVDRIADRIVAISRGTLLADDRIDSLRARYLKVSFLFEVPPGKNTVIPGALRINRGLREWVAIFDSRTAVDMHALARDIGAVSPTTHFVSAEDIFSELFGSVPNER